MCPASIRGVLRGSELDPVHSSDSSQVFSVFTHETIIFAILGNAGLREV